MAEIRPPFRADLDSGIKKTYLNTICATGDNLANCFAVELYKGNAAYTLPSNATVKGYFVQYGSTNTIELSGTKSGNVASVTLQGACYNKSGPFTLTIKVLEGSAVTTVFYGEGSVSVSRTESTVNPGSESVEYSRYPVNLLDNSNFASWIAQAGFVQTHGTTWYAADRWLVGGVNNSEGRTLTVTQLSEAARLVTTYQYLYIAQKVTNVNGKTLTFAMKALRNQAIAVRIYDLNGNLLKGGSFTGTGTFVNTVTATVPSDVNTVMCYIYPGFVGGGGTAEIYWTALYEGEYTDDYLPTYMPQRYAVELAECKRHCLYMSSSKNVTIFPAVAYSATTLYGNIPHGFRTSRPLVTFNSLIVAGTGVSSAPAVTNMSVVESNSGTTSIMVTCDGANFTAGQAYNVWFSQSGGNMCISAEL